MYNNLIIKNFKSIYENEIELGRINVFIGENGSGKSNILEAVGFYALGKEEGKINAENLYSIGVRPAKPSLTINSFLNKESKNLFEVIFVLDKEYKASFKPKNEDIFTEWETFHIEKKMLDVRSARIAKLKQLKSDVDDLFQIYNTIKDKESLNLNIEELRDEIYEQLKQINNEKTLLIDFLIYCLNTKSLRGIYNESRKNPLGINGENLDVLLANFDKEERNQILEYKYLISWLEDFFIDTDDRLKLQGYKINRSQSGLYFQDKFMGEKNNIFSSENSNEGILYVLFYLALFISKRTPKFFAIDNIETCLNPHLCTETMRILCKLAKENDRQALITTHNPAILDGLDLNDDEVRLFEVYRNDSGHTKTRRIKLKPNTKSKRKLSELWTRGFLGAISKEF